VFNTLNLSDVEKQSTKLILLDFNQKHDGLVAKFNSTAETVASPDIKKFLQDQDSLVQFAKEQLEASLSSNSTVRLHAHVQKEKSRMRVSIDN
jgi:hypothetical protein